MLIDTCQTVFKWIAVKHQLPPTRRPLLFLGQSGYIKPHDVMIISGYYDPEYRPKSPWLDSHSSCLSEEGFTPEYWAYLDSDQLPTTVVDPNWDKFEDGSPVELYDKPGWTED